MNTASIPLRWHFPPSELSLNQGDIHVWRIDQSLTKPENLRRYLSLDELERAGRYQFSADRDFYMARRGALRLVLAQYLEIPAGAISFAYTAYQKPKLADDLAASQIHFNLTHSRDLALLAIA